MSYSSRLYQQSWVYHPDGDTHADRVGRILAQGVDLGATLRSKAVDTAKRDRQNEIDEDEKRKAGPSGGDLINQTSTSGNKPEPDGRGMVWVTPDGQTLGQVTTERFRELPPPPTPKSLLTTERQKNMAKLTATERSMHMWRKINPGCVESTTKLPLPTYKDHFSSRPADVHPIDMTYHRMKTEFSEYTDQKVRFGVTNNL